jgi:hypothetical protein
MIGKHEVSRAGVYNMQESVDGAIRMYPIDVT